MKILFTILMLAFCSPAIGAIRVKSDKGNFLSQDHLEWSGNVHAENDGETIECERLNVLSGFVRALGNVRVKRQGGEANAETVTYDPLTKKLTLEGGVKIHTSQLSLVAEKGTSVNWQDGQLTVKGRNTVTFYPKIKNPNYSA